MPGLEFFRMKPFVFSCDSHINEPKDLWLANLPPAMRDKGLGTRKDIRVKVLAKGEITKPLTVHAHAFSASAPNFR